MAHARFIWFMIMVAICLTRVAGKGGGSGSGSSGGGSSSSGGSEGSNKGGGGEGGGGSQSGGGDESSTSRPCQRSLRFTQFAVPCIRQYGPEYYPDTRRCIMYRLGWYNQAGFINMQAVKSDLDGFRMGSEVRRAVTNGLAYCPVDLDVGFYACLSNILMSWCPVWSNGGS